MDGWNYDIILIWRLTNTACRGFKTCPFFTSCPVRRSLAKLEKVKDDLFIRPVIWIRHNEGSIQSLFEEQYLATITSIAEP